MKRIITTLLLLTAAFNPAFAADFMAGEFTVEKESYAVYLSQEECQEEGSTWDQEMEMCFIKVTDRLSIVKAEDKFNLEMVTWGGNMHSCGFEGTAEVVADNKLRSVTEGSEWVDGDWQDKDCVVDITFKDQNTVSVEANQACQIYCGMRAQLYMEDATRE